MVERQTEVLKKKVENDLLQKGVKQEEIAGNMDKFTADIAVEAENKVRIYFILSSIASEEKLTVSAEEVDEWLKSLADYYKKEFSEVKKYYNGQTNLLDGVEETDT